jgi:hypothetical protein
MINYIISAILFIIIVIACNIISDRLILGIPIAIDQAAIDQIKMSALSAILIMITIFILARTGLFKINFA